MRKLFGLAAGVMMLWFAAVPCAVGADDGIPVPPAEPQIRTVPDQGLLGQEFKDEANGFQIQLPFGVRIFQRAGLELVSFVQDAKQWGGNVELVTLDKDTTVAEQLRSRSGDLSKVFKDVQILESKETIVSGKPAGKLVSSMAKDYPVQVDKDGKPTKMQTIPLLRQELMVQTATNQYMVLTFFSPLTEKDEAITVFNAMVGSFELLDRKAIEARRVAAVKVGQDWLAHIHAEDLVGKLVTEPQMFRIKIENKDVGYLRIDEIADASRDGFKGILVLANSRTFPANGSLILGSNEAFWAYHNQGGKLGELPSYSTWANKSGTQTPGDASHRVRPQPQPQPQSAEIHPGQIIRGVAELPPTGVVKWNEEVGTLQLSMHPVPVNNTIEFRPLYELNVVVMANTQDAGSAQSEPLKAYIKPDMPAPFPKPLEYLWPRLVDLTKESQMAMLVFNSGQNKLGLRILTVGKQEIITVDSNPVRVTRLTDEMGASSTTMWVDSKGVIQMMRTSDGTVLLPTTEEEMRKLWSGTLARFR